MASQQIEASALRISKIFPWHYQFLFMVLEPGILLIAVISIMTDPASHYHSLAPASSSGPFYTFSSQHALCAVDSAWNTPQLRGLWYTLVSAFSFTVLVEPVVLYTARYRLRDAHDAEEVIKAVLLSFTVFDVFHAGATLAVTGIEAATPGHAKGFIYTMINVWAPALWMVFRASWLLGIGRETSARQKKE